ncbi:UPF0175 family protein [Fibrobacter sp. UWEL]|uniref:UPF0175 family protein n=1 Tax=Fibrobacter sp. UWEL TaxID=1896209 RepID=UPI00091A5EA3|nr:UPF0175 family protein [Fibrobacter sp. UWEL]SHK96237.1 Uncharacterised protein family (UPF0175) [Fibrobacter sp. UWEL]
MVKVAKDVNLRYIVSQRFPVCQISMNIPEEVLFDTHMNKERALSFAKCAVALEFYRNLGVSVGYCAEIAGMTEEDFVKYLGSKGISIFHFENENEFMEELKNA